MRCARLKTRGLLTGATISKTGDTYPLSTTQNHWSMEGRPIIREANLTDYKEHPEFVKNMNQEEPEGGAKPMYPNPFDSNPLTGKPGYITSGEDVD